MKVEIYLIESGVFYGLVVLGRVRAELGLVLELEYRPRVVVQLIKTLGDLLAH